jgi:dCMP deaminase
VRPDWNDYFLGIAEAVARRADCTRRKAGAVIVKDHRIVSTGYNGAPAGSPGCLEGACPRGRLSREEIPPGSSYDTGPGSCIALHAEQNAVIYADYGKMKGAVIYVTSDPCDGCLRMIRGAGIARTVIPKGRESESRTLGQRTAV